MVWVYFAGLMAVSFAVTRLMLPKVMGMLTEAGFVKPNYRMEEIPLGVGMVFFLSTVIVLTGAVVFGWVKPSVYAFVFAVGGMSFFGLIDDVFGTRHATGLKGHFKKLFVDKELTTGALKALAGGLIAIMVSLQSDDGAGLDKWILLILNSLIIALSTNAVNLFDLRPGRAAKVFLLIGVFLALAGCFSTSGSSEHIAYLAVITGSLLAYLPVDLKARAMMGDTGSNVLGLTLGYVTVFIMSIPLKVGFLLLLLGFHILTEKYSLTKIIEKNKFLNYIDMIGRK
ncbi:hypothetical protein [Phosphitispora sp. TUW77]|uniref:hypothetical protein n=1 Tax=Phosphitispora sp. TUW77 TaxID=3152361 RepID=UPI003AB148DF